MKVRTATIDDIDQLTLLFDAYRVFYKKTSDPIGAKSFLVQRFDHGDSIILVCESENKLIGFAQMYRSYSSASLGRVLVLNDLYVINSARRQGVGQALISEAVSQGKKIGAARMDLSTEKSNSKAQNLYRKMGWVEDEIFLHFSLKPNE